MGALIIAFFCGIVFSILCNEAAKALGRKMATMEDYL